jgi:hypothetical protein
LYGCSKNNIQNNIEDTDTYIPNQDSQYGFVFQDLCIGNIAESPNGYYFLSGTTINYLYFFDDVTKKAYPLCDKPDCLHADEPDCNKIADCNAFLGSRIRFLNYYDDHIYYVSTDVSQTGDYDALYREEPDGTARKLMYKFRVPVSYLEIHRGFVYYSTDDLSSIQPDQESRTKTKFELCRIKLENPGDPETLYSDEQAFGHIEYMLCYGNSIYYSVIYYPSDNIEDCVNFINKTDIDTGKTTTVADNGGAFLTIFKDHLIYFSGVKAPVGTYTCDLDGNNRKKISDMFGYSSANKNNLFIDTYPYARAKNQEAQLLIFGGSFTIMKTISLSELKPMDFFLGCSDGYCFFSSYNGDNEYGNIMSVKYIPVDKITNDMKLSTLYQFVPKVPNVGVTTE